LVEHDCTDRDIEVAHAMALLVLVECDGYGVLKDAIPVFDTANQSILADMREDAGMSGEKAVDGLQF
jgi:hypothetical protein